MNTTHIVLNILFAVLAVGALAFLTRLAAKVAGGHFEELETHSYAVEEPELLERAA